MNTDEKDIPSSNSYHCTMNIFITGGSGFVGGAIISRLKEKHNLFAMSRSENSASKVEALGAKSVLCDLENISPEQLEGIDVVVHAAAYVEPWGKLKYFWGPNVEGTRRMLETARAAGVKRFIHVSTESVLFHGQDMDDIDETYPYPNKSPFSYSETKKEAEKLVLAANVPHEFATLSLRPRLVWGPGDTTILKNLCKLVDKGDFRWINKGKAITSTCYIENYAQAIELALENGRGGEAYFITDDEFISVRSLIDQLLGSTGRKASNKNLSYGFARVASWGLEAIWKTLGIRKQPPTTRFSVALIASNCTIRIDKAKEELGYQPEYSIQSGMEKLKEWATENGLAV